VKPVPFNRPYLTYDEAVLRETARRYGVEYLVTIDRDSRHPAFRERPPEAWPQIYEPVYQDDHLGIWRVMQ
jgi:hypothetical protein